MKTRNPLRLIAAGFVLLLMGFLLLLVMVIRLIDPCFVLSFIAYVASSTGLLLTIIGIIQRSR